MKKKLFAVLLSFCMLNTLCPGMPPPESALAAENVIIDAADYGADPTGAEDSAQQIQAAFAAARKAKENGAAHVTVSFPQGEYHIYKDYAEKREYHTSNTNSIENPEKTIGILIEDQEDFTLQGNGSLFIMHGNMMALAVVNSKNVTLENFSWDFGVPTVSEMTVEEIGTTEDQKPYTDYLIPECFPHQVTGNTLTWYSEKSPYTGEYYWTQTGIHSPSYGIGAYQPGGGMSRSYYTNVGPFENVVRIEEKDDTHIRIVYSSKSSGMQEMQQEGAVIQLAANAHRQTAGAFTWESENITAKQVNVHYMHGFGWLIQMSRDVFYYDCSIVPREGSGHMVTSFADGIHASGAAGQLVIENCNFSDTHDDPINLHGTFTRVEQRIDSHTLQLKYIHNQQGGFPQYHVGDEVAFFTRDTLESTDNETLYTVEEIVSNPGEQGNDLRTMVIRFKEPLPENLMDKIGSQPKYVAENVTYAPEVTIRGCSFQNVPTRGILCTTRNKVLIEDNTFHAMTMATIYLSNDSDEWYESGPIRDMTIRNNTFYIKTIGRTSWEYAPAVYVHPVTRGGGFPSADNPIHKNITIEGNTFYMDTDTVVKAESVENLTIRDNRILRYNPVTIRIEASLLQDGGQAKLLEGSSMGLNVDAQWKHYTLPTENAYEFTKCKNVTLEGNAYDEGMKLYAVLSDMPDEYLNNQDADIRIAHDRNQPAADPVGEIRYVSSNPDVLTIDSAGRMTGLKPGTATVCAYYESNGRQFPSNEITVTVVGKNELDPADIVTIKDAGKTPILTEKNAEFQFTASIPSGKPITWAVEDFLTGGATDAASVSQDGTVTALKNGIVWVRAGCGLSSDRKALIVSLPESGRLSPDFTILREDTANYSLTANQITVDMQSGDLYQENNTAANLFLYSIPDSIAKNSMRTVIKADNLPIRESGQWDTASFILYKDDDNYLTVGKKSHYDGIATVTETDGRATEAGGSSEQNELTSAWLGFYKNGNTVSVDYKTDGGAWQHVSDLNADMLGNDYKIGFTAWESNDRGKTAVFSEFRIGSGSLSYEALCSQPAISFLESENQAPDVSEVSFDQASYQTGDTATVRYTYTDPDNDAEGNTRYCFTLADGRQNVTDTPSVLVTQPGEIRCQVFPADQKGRPGAASAIAAAAVIDRRITEARNALTQELNAAASMDLAPYSAETVSVFQNALNAAKACADNENAGFEALRDALQQLQAAKAGLTRKTDPVLPGSQTPVQNAPDSQTPAPSVKALPKKGTVFTKNGIRYKITKSGSKNKTVSVTKQKGKSKSKVTIPATVKKDGYTFQVTSIEKNAFSGKKLRAITLGKHVTSIGAQAFRKCTQLKSITFKGTKAPSIGKKAFQNTPSGCSVTVSKKMKAKQFGTLQKRLQANGLHKAAYIMP